MRILHMALSCEIFKWDNPLPSFTPLNSWDIYFIKITGPFKPWCWIISRNEKSFLSFFILSQPSAMNSYFAAIMPWLTWNGVSMLLGHYYQQWFWSWSVFEKKKPLNKQTALELSSLLFRLSNCVVCRSMF